MIPREKINFEANTHIEELQPNVENIESKESSRGNKQHIMGVGQEDKHVGQAKLEQVVMSHRL